MELTTTGRNFAVLKFKDAYGENCSLQKSYIADYHAVWLGVTAPKLTVYENESHGKYIITEMPDNFSVHCRMHLTQEQVSELLPYLMRFAETGEIQCDPL